MLFFRMMTLVIIFASAVSLISTAPVTDTQDILCTEAMFNERARAYGKQEASLIVIPRASGTEIEPWKIAGAMASLVSGAYVVSSNRIGLSLRGTHFGGGGFAYAPQGRLLAATTPANPVQTFELDPKMPAFAQRSYPCYVPEIE